VRLTSEKVVKGDRAARSAVIRRFTPAAARFPLVFAPISLGTIILLFMPEEQPSSGLAVRLDRATCEEMRSGLELPRVFGPDGFEVALPPKRPDSAADAEPSR
jgi:hypothetical protein